ncbi:MAG: hypothetical protein JWM80_2783 [Cyanobacteria bacterium RYN_339]|nr:hypothetical protein [Cyanobacteria bacterium RYN_339]
MASGCAPVTPSLSQPATEGTVSSDAFGNVQIQVAGHSYLLKPLDGRPVGSVSIQIGGKVYNTVEGKFHLPASALSDFQTNSRGFFRVFAPGYVPRQVWIGTIGDEIPLVPLLAIKVVDAFPSSGGTIASPEAGIAVNLPVGLLVKPTTAIQVSTYVPAVDDGPTAVAASLASRQAFLTKLAALKGTSQYSLAAADCANAEQPLPCPPARAGLGVMLTVNGPLQAGTVTSQIDLDVAAQDPLRANAAARLLQTFRQMDASPDGLTMRHLLAEGYGISLTGHLLSFAVHLGTTAVLDGFVRIEVEGLDLLGVNMEFTAVSAIRDSLPQGALTPGLSALTRSLAPATFIVAAAAPLNALLAVGQRLIAPDNSGSSDSGSLGVDGTGFVTRKAGLISQDGGSLISQDGASIVAQGGGNIVAQGGGNIVAQGGGNIVAQGGGNIVAQGGGNLISNDGGSLVGHLAVPFGVELAAKYALASYADYPWPNQAQVRAVTFSGRPITRWVTTDINSNFSFYKLPPTPLYFWLEAKAGPHILRSLAVAPASGQVISTINAATTCVSSAAYNALVINIADADLLTAANVNADEVALRALLDQPTSQAVVDAPIAGVSAIALQRFVAGAVVPRSFRIGTLSSQVLCLPAQIGQVALNPWLAPVYLSPLLGDVAVLGNSTVTNTGPTVLTGNLDLYPGTSITGFLPGTVAAPGTVHQADGSALQAQLDLTSAYDDAAGRLGGTVLPLTMGGQTVFPGVYRSGSSLRISSAGLTLDANGDPNAVFIFQLGSTLTLDSGSQISLINGAQAGNVFWQIGSSATLGTYSTCKGTLLANTSITITTGAALEGRALARNGAVTLDSNTINKAPLSQTSCP